MITFIFDEKQATEAMVFLLSLGGDSMSLMKALKMLYLADRASMSNGHDSITTDSYISLPDGPSPSNILDCIRWNSGEEWNKHIRTNGNLVEVYNPIEHYEKLSRYYMETLSNVYERFKDYNLEELESCCRSLGEWKNPHVSSLPISIESIIENSVHKDKRADVLEELEEYSFVQQSNLKIVMRTI